MSFVVEATDIETTHEGSVRHDDCPLEISSFSLWQLDEEGYILTTRGRLYLSEQAKERYRSWVKTQAIG